MYHGFSDQFLRIFEITIFWFVVDICDLVTMWTATSILKYFPKYE